MGQYDFKKDLKEGHDAEEEVLVILKKKYPKAHRIEGYFKDFDIYVPEVDKKLEVKHDWAVRNTGNYFIETEFNKKEDNGDITPVSCGVDATLADYWVIVDHEVIIVIEIDTLRHILQDYRIVTLPPKKTSFGGKGYLVRKDNLIHNPYVLVIDKSDKEAVIEI